MTLIDALKIHEKNASGDSVDVVRVVDELSDVFLRDLPIPCIAQHVFRLHDGLYGLFTHGIVVVLHEGSNNFFVEVAVFIEAESFEEVNE